MWTQSGWFYLVFSAALNASYWLFPLTWASVRSAVPCSLLLILQSWVDKVVDITMTSYSTQRNITDLGHSTTTTSTTTPTSTSLLSSNIFCCFRKSILISWQDWWHETDYHWLPMFKITYRSLCLLPALAVGIFFCWLGLRTFLYLDVEEKYFHLNSKLSEFSPHTSNWLVMLTVMMIAWLARPGTPLGHFFKVNLPA